MAIPYVTGPAHIYVGVGPNYAPLYLGTAERAPKIEINPEWEPVFNDLGGSKVPLDVQYMGEHGFVAADINRWNEPVYAAMAARPLGPSQAPRGVDSYGEIGTLMLTEGGTYPLWVVFPYAAKAVFAANNMPAGYHFFNAYLMGPDTLEPLGTVHRKVRMIWHALRAFDVLTGTFYLYDHDTTGLPAIN